ncbi:MAG: ribose 5-phosphate isomerase B [Erysipelothrix sp.]|nr:ribose 5-phosphate isomerase B [Erysipelothrix sp.]
MRIAISSDHGGFEHKQLLIEAIKAMGHTVEDFGVYADESVDYPDFIYPAAKSVASNSNDLGIIICGTGIGASIVANKVRGIRCALVTSVEVAQLTREHNDSNVLALAGRTTDYETNLAIVKAWLETPFSEGDRHKQRIQKISDIEVKEDRK